MRRPSACAMPCVPRSRRGRRSELWQSKPVPAQGLFVNRTGFGGTAFPWNAAPPVDYSLAQYPQSNALLESSLVLFSHTLPDRGATARTRRAVCRSVRARVGVLADVLARSS